MRRTLIALALTSALGLAQAATVSVYANLAAWQAAISGSDQLQDFSGYAARFEPVSRPERIYRRVA